MAGFFKRRRILKNTSALDLVPVRLFDHKTNEEGNVTILVPKFKNEKFARFFIPSSKSIYISIHLDELGSATWLAMDGNKNTDTICKELSQKFGDKIHPAQERVVKFLSGLYHNKQITFKQLLDE
ncbi:MAG: PqqD family protein [Bacteroidales bacterium]